MLKQVTVNIIVDDHEPEKCGDCSRRDLTPCSLFSQAIVANYRCKQCLKEAE